MSSHLKKSKNEFLRMALILFLITSIIGGLLAVVHHFTAPVVERSAEERLNHSLQELMADAAEFSKIVEYSESIFLGDVQVPVRAVYIAKDSAGQALGYCVNVAPKGYSDVIDMMVAIDIEGAVSDVDILSISDSSGIGSKVQTDDQLRNAVKGINDSVKLVKQAPASKSEVQAIAGATVSSAAYVNGVNAAVEVVQLIRAGEVAK